MFLFSGIYIAAAFILFSYGIGDASLVYANIINLSARILYCLWFVSSYFHKLQGSGPPWRHVFPGWIFILLAGMTRLLVHYSAMGLNVEGQMMEMKRTALNLNMIVHIAFGCFLAAITLSAWWYQTGRYITVPRSNKKYA
jgi:oligosaccharide translocation protein RFT1